MHAEQRLEQAPGRDESGAGVEREEHQDEECRQRPQHARAVVEPALEVIRHRERVAELLGARPERRRDELPVEVGADDEPQDQPDRVQSRDVGEPRQPHQQPAAHVRRLGAQGRHPAAERAATENEVRKIRGPAVGDEAQHQADSHVDDDRPDDGGHVGHASRCRPGARHFPLDQRLAHSISRVTHEMQRKIHGTVILMRGAIGILASVKDVPPPDDPGDSGTARGSISRTSAAGTDALSPGTGPYTGAGIPPLPRFSFARVSAGRLTTPQATGRSSPAPVTDTRRRTGSGD